MAEINMADLVIVSIFAISCLIGIYRGILREIVSLCTWVLAIVLAFLHGKDAGQIFTFVDSESLKKILGSVSIFVTVIIIGIIAKYFIFRSMHVGKPSGFGRLLGMLYGAFRAGLLIVLAMLFLTTAKVEGDKLYQNSMIIPKFQVIIDNLDLRVAEDLKKNATKNANKESTNAKDAKDANEEAADPVIEVPVIELNVDQPTQ